LKRQLLARIETLERTKSPVPLPTIVITFVGRDGEQSPAYVLKGSGLVLASAQQLTNEATSGGFVTER